MRRTMSHFLYVRNFLLQYTRTFLTYYPVEKFRSCHAQHLALKLVDPDEMTWILEGHLA